jgi:hypothetical protein
MHGIGIKIHTRMLEQGCDAAWRSYWDWTIMKCYCGILCLLRLSRPNGRELQLIAVLYSECKGAARWGHFFTNCFADMVPALEFVVCGLWRPSRGGRFLPASACLWAGLSAGRAVMNRKTLWTTKKMCANRWLVGHWCVVQLLRAYCHRVPVVWFAWRKVMSHSFR